jgi:hypothetical protein
MGDDEHGGWWAWVGVGVWSNLSERVQAVAHVDRV